VRPGADVNLWERLNMKKAPSVSAAGPLHEIARFRDLFRERIHLSINACNQRASRRSVPFAGVRFPKKFCSKSSASAFAAIPL